MTDPLLGSVGAAGQDAPPVLLVEYKTAMVQQDPATGQAEEVQVETAILAGMHRFTYPAAVLRPADGWSVRRATHGLDVVTTEGVWAHCRIDPDPVWVDAADRTGSVLVLTGPRLGLRRPADRTEATYGLAERRAEIIDARRMGLVVAGFARWHPELLDDALAFYALLPSPPRPLLVVQSPLEGQQTADKYVGYLQFRGMEPVSTLRGRLQLPVVGDWWAAYATAVDLIIVERGQEGPLWQAPWSSIPGDWRAAFLADRACAVLSGQGLGLDDADPSRHLDNVEAACAAGQVAGGVVLLDSSNLPGH